jgi:hypothetical protein
MHTHVCMCWLCLQGPMVGQISYAVSAARVNSNISWTGLTANTDYLLRLIAVDTAGNCQAAFTDLAVHTLDNIPPITLAFEVVQIGGTTASLQITLDEPGTVFHAVMPRGTACPAPAALFAAVTAQPTGAVAAGSAAVLQGNMPAIGNVSGLTSETDYTACVVAADATKLQNRQAAGLSKDFRTLDITPPTVVIDVMPGTHGNFTCNRCGWVGTATAVVNRGLFILSSCVTGLLSAPCSLLCLHQLVVCCLSECFECAPCRSTFLCSLKFSTSLSEPGSIVWVLPLATNTSRLPTPSQLQLATDASLFFLAGSTPYGPMQFPAAGAWANATVTGLASDTQYTMVVSAKDVAPQANYVPSLVLLQLTAPDVRPPLFTGRLAGSAQHGEHAGTGSLVQQEQQLPHVAGGCLHVTRIRCVCVGGGVTSDVFLLKGTLHTNMH